MPGFKGSSLQIENGPVIWPNLIRAHFNKRVSLGLHLPVVGLENPLSLVSRGVVESVGIIPPFLKQDVYGPFLQVLRETLPKELDIIHFHYDWRNELEEAVEDLRGLVNTLSQTHHGPIDIISHSMGGLITTRILQMTESDCIRNVFFVGTPFKGVARVLMDLEYGNKFGFNKTLLSPKALGSFPSIYYLLPRYEQAVRNLDIYNLDIWKQYEIGYLAKQDHCSSMKYLNYQLKKSKSFWEDLELGIILKSSKLRLHYINNQTKKTIEQIHIGERMKPIYGKGDSTVSNISLKRPNFLKEIPGEYFTSSKSHGYCFTNKELLKIVLSKLDY